MSPAAGQFDVVVVGGGPAGSSAARVLAAAGVRVLVLEKARMPRYKTCGGGILGGAVRRLGGVPEGIVERACGRVALEVVAGERFEVERAAPVVLMTMREAFDAWLLGRARAAGAEVWEGAALMELTEEQGGVRVMTGRGEVLAKFVIAADGAHGVTAKKAGFEDGRRMVPALEWEVEVGAEVFGRLSAVARFDFYPVPAGYAWVFPKRGHLSIGVMTHAPGRVNLNRCVEGYMRGLGMGDAVSVEKHGYVIPLSPRKAFVRRRVLLVGDAAGVADPVTAEGIGPGIHTGELAGRAIVDGGLEEGRVRGAYEGAMGREVLPELLWGRRLARVLYGRPGVRDALFRWQGQRLTEAMMEVVAGRRGYREMMTSPGNYWRLMFGRKGRVRA